MVNNNLQDVGGNFVQLTIQCLQYFRINRLLVGGLGESLYHTDPPGSGRLPLNFRCCGR